MIGIEASRLRTRRATRWVKSGLSMMTRISGAAVMTASAVSPDQPHDLRQSGGHGHSQPHDRAIPRSETAGSAPHRVIGAAADADEIDGLTEERWRNTFIKRGPEPVAGFLRCDQEESAAPTMACHRRRTHAVTPDDEQATFAAFALAIMACGSATTAFPDITASPASPAFATPSTVRGPMRRRGHSAGPGQPWAPSRGHHGRASANGYGPPSRSLRRAPTNRRCPRCPRRRRHGRRSRPRPARLSKGPSARSTCAALAQYRPRINDIRPGSFQRALAASAGQGRRP